jgi:hypothetical protein
MASVLREICLGVSLVGALGLAVACGSSVLEGDGVAAATTATAAGTGTGGMSSSAVTSSGGTISTGSAQGGANVTVTSAGGAGTTASTGMMASSSVASSTAASSGSGGTMPMCPASQPQGGSVCPQLGFNCAYGMNNTTQCTCTNNGWNCTSCPSMQPNNGAQCFANSSSTCDYGANQCHCIFGQWQCGQCPANAPMNMSMCPTTGLLCPYNGQNCQCQGFQNKQWNCQGTCPQSQPMPGQSCSLSSQLNCQYGNVTCKCFNGKFLCG